MSDFLKSIHAHDLPPAYLCDEPPNFPKHDVPKVPPVQPKVRRARAKNRSIVRSILVGLTAVDVKVFGNLERVAQSTAGVSATTVMRASISHYAAYLKEMGETDEGTAQVKRELRAITGDR